MNSLETSESGEDKPKMLDQPLFKIAKSIVDFAQRVEEMVEVAMDESNLVRELPVTKVYFMRDCFWPMFADNLLSIGRGQKKSACAVMISRSTIGNKLFDDVINPMMAYASDNAGGGRKGFIDFIKKEIGKLLESNEGFANSCKKAIQHLINQGALKLENGEVGEQNVIFVDTGYKTFPAFMKALLESGTTR